MPTKFILFSSAVLLGITGVPLTFAPAEAASLIGWPISASILIQIVGAVYFSYAMINWMSKGNLIGGIYNRPLAVGNLTHFVIGALALIKMPDKTLVVYCITTVYTIYAIAFTLILFTHPVKESKTE
ncbi:MAG: hypothetical protein QM734_08450 [Cyclobacteriaceae bacterium]